MSNYSGNFAQTVRESTASTTDATVTTIETINVPPSTTYYLRCIVMGRRTGGSAGSADDSAAIILTACYKDVSGTATIVGSVDKTSLEDQPAWDANLSVSSGTVLLRVTGATNNNINWVSHTEITRVDL